MVTFTYIVGSVLAVLLAGAFGIAAHYCRSHFTYAPERITGNVLIDDALSPQDITFEDKVIGAKWDDNGFWDVDSNRNLIYYVLSCMGLTLFSCLALWPMRADLVGQFCTMTAQLGLHSPLC